MRGGRRSEAAPADTLLAGFSPGPPLTTCRNAGTSAHRPGLEHPPAAGRGGASTEGLAGRWTREPTTSRAELLVLVRDVLDRLPGR